MSNARWTIQRTLFPRIVSSSPFIYGIINAHYNHFHALFSFLNTAWWQVTKCICNVTRRIAYIVCTSPAHHHSDYMLLHLMSPSCSLSVFPPNLCTEPSCSEWEKRLEPHPTCRGDRNQERDYSVYMVPCKSGNACSYSVCVSFSCDCSQAPTKLSNPWSTGSTASDKITLLLAPPNKITLFLVFCCWHSQYLVLLPSIIYSSEI